MRLQAISKLEGLLVSSGSPCISVCRHKTRLNIQKPRAPHWEKAKLLRLTKPVLPRARDILSEHLGCYKILEQRSQKEVNPLEVLLGRQVYAECDQAKLILIYHRNSMHSNEIHKAWQMLKKAGYMYHKRFNNTIAGHAFSDTRFEQLLCLCHGHTSLVTSRQDQMAPLLRIQKKMPQLILIGGVLEYRFMSSAELQCYAGMPDLEATRAQLAALLSAPAAALSSSLNYHQSALVRLLASHAKSQPSEDSPDDGV